MRPDDVRQQLQAARPESLGSHGTVDTVVLQTYEQHCRFGQKLGTIAYIQVIKKRRILRTYLIFLSCGACLT